MKKAILARKIGMTQIFNSDGTLVAVTVLQAGPCVVVQKKTPENDGYSAVKAGFGEINPKRVRKPLAGQFRKAECAPFKILREFRLDTPYEVGAEIKADIFASGDKVDVVGISKGKGFQGAIKRHGMHRGPMSHGSKYHRALGSLSSATTPGKVKKNKRMPGHAGAVRVTVQNLTVVRADAEKNLLLIRGAVPGTKGTALMVRDSVKAR
jgi:large subunit ribosomal protein L3